VIENGLTRLDLPAPLLAIHAGAAQCQDDKASAGQDGMRKSWDTALAKAGTKSKLVEKDRIEGGGATKGFFNR